ncbi:MAG TPA: hypothetical protein VH024_05435 [Candidatus Angelobacter sp.]|nr:hypothetical protein [Candidatus Angelobacter sp.]
MTLKLRLGLMACAFLAGSVGIAAAQNWGYDRDDDRGYRYEQYNRNDRDDYGRGMQVARSIGFEDGEQIAREDMWHRKPFNPYPRGHNHAERGYARDFGSVQEYREQYARAYQQGYNSAFHRDRSYR